MEPAQQSGPWYKPGMAGEDDEDRAATVGTVEPGWMFIQGDYGRAELEAIKARCGGDCRER
ncbi:hypothetical protein CTA1_4377 [Colletotrichum tanaceti]|uniref:Uncharacterized protein n=1 Tax=Colletotrichum tanaceti TaxID=1306861 RepID=A0A4U6X615_9PEZI|nr:hypothetical protein CTA1_4377 [Colletotrichum tanaceti]